jgi:hypothetical protein
MTALIAAAASTGALAETTWAAALFLGVVAMMKPRRLRGDVWGE